MTTITRTVSVDVDVDLAGLRTTDLTNELQRRGIQIDDDEYATCNCSDITNVTDRELEYEVRARGYLISQVGNLTRSDIDFILQSKPDTVKIGSEAYFAYEKLKEMYSYATS